MAPVNRIRTYKNKKQQNLPGSELALNYLLANNLKKRLETSNNSPGTSGRDPQESTFDRLLKGKVYNNVAFKKFPSYSNENSASSIFSTSNGSSKHIIQKEFDDSLPKSSSRTNSINQSILSPVVILDRFRNEENYSSTQTNRKTETKALKNHKLEEESYLVPSNGLINISHSGGNATQDHNAAEEWQQNDTNISEFENTEKMLLMESLELQRTDNTYFNFKDSVGTVSTPKNKRNIYCLRKHLNFNSINTHPVDSTNSISYFSVKGGENSRKYQVVENVSTHQSNIIEVNESIELLSINSTPLSIKNPRSQDQTSRSLLSESLNIINEWSNRCPTPSSFNSSVQNRFKCKQKLEGGVKPLKKKKQSKLFKKSRVILEYVPHLENMIKHALKNQDTPSVDLRFMNVRRISNNFVSIRKKKRNSIKKLPPLKNCNVFLSPLKLCDLENSIKSSDTMAIKSISLSQISESNNSLSILRLDPEVSLEAESERLSIPATPWESEKQNKANSQIKDNSSIEQENMNISGKHKCSKECQHFKKIPWVILQRCDFSKYTFRKKSDMINPKKSLSVNRSSNEFRGYNNDYSKLSNPYIDKFKNFANLINKNLLREKHDWKDNLKANSPMTKDNCSGKNLVNNSNQFKIKQCFVILKEMTIDMYNENKNEIKMKENELMRKENEPMMKEKEPMLKENERKRKSSDHYASSEVNNYITLPISQSLIEECDEFNEAPLQTREFVSLPPGKKFRRSIAIFKKNLELDHSEKSPLKKRITLHKRHSVKLIPVHQNKNKSSELASFALANSGYVSLRQSFRRSSLEEVENYLPNVQPIENYLNYIANKSADQLTARDIVLKRCGQTEPLRFEKCYPRSVLQHCQKIGEGVFGEVFMIRDKSGSTTVMKVIPIEGEQIVNLEKQKTFEEIVSEIIISMELSNLEKTKRNNTDAFVKVKGIRCVQGCYPHRLLELWELYDENKQSENDSPEMFLEDQLYIVIELANAGQDLEAFLLNNAQQALSIFEQITCALAVAESELQFEHRDLHWGNVLITLTEQKNTAFVLDGKEIVVNNRGAKATIIDFTLSRVEYEGVIIFNDLSMDEDLFTAKGDYQFDIYRKMQENNGNRWQGFKPFSNILWLHYILDKALNGFRYKNVKSKQHRASLAILRAYEQKLLEYNSATDFVLNNFINNVTIE